ncbi:MAG: gfo/Idh/MocA family oxidoreductase [Candidatus Marinimicrobia bacterium]|nr:gfo/Idh/MocA family oxidoreductase [Candidatus Neomarinimicrobiota bacterium]
MAEKTQMTRRNFLKQSAGVAAGILAAPYFVPDTLLGKVAPVAPSEKVTMGCVGVGWQGTSNLESFLREPDVQVLALCDIDDEHLENAKRIVEEKQGVGSVQTYHNFEELLARDDIDTVSLGLPDHWHSIPAIRAAESGKDIFGEKPLAHTLKEGRAICDAVRRYDRVWQTGSWQRSQSHFRFAAMLVRNGRIGKVHTVEVGLPSGHTDFEGSGHLTAVTEPPEVLDYNMWVGPAPYFPYVPAKVHKNWRWNYDTGGGQLLDWVGHHVDIAHWGMGFDKTGPHEIDGYGEFPETGIWNTATRFKVLAKYPNDVDMIIAGAHDDVCLGKRGTLWKGDLGWVWVDRSGIDAEPKSLLEEKFSPDETHLYKSPGHWRDFIDSVKDRTETITPCETAHRSASPGHLGQISMMLGRKIKFNPETEEIIGDPTAARMLGKSMRSPWQV